MPASLQLSDVKVLILCGGLGTRLSSVVSDRPKVMALIGDKPFLALLLEKMAASGLRRFVLATGHMAGHIEEYFGDGSSRNLEIQYSHESTPLGTGGAVKLAASRLSDFFFLMNGDTWMDFDPARMVEELDQRSKSVAIALVGVENASRYGSVQLDEEENFVSFQEKRNQAAPGWINGGVYLMNKSLFKSFPEAQAFSIERDLLAQLPPNQVQACLFRGRFIDIGIPEDYRKAQNELAQFGEPQESRGG